MPKHRQKIGTGVVANQSRNAVDLGVVFHENDRMLDPVQGFMARPEANHSRAVCHRFNPHE
jgi:hypothetical protein